MGLSRKLLASTTYILPYISVSYALYLLCSTPLYLLPSQIKHIWSLVTSPNVALIKDSHDASHRFGIALPRHLTINCGKITYNTKHQSAKGGEVEPPTEVLVVWIDTIKYLSWCCSKQKKKAQNHKNKEKRIKITKTKRKELKSQKQRKKLVCICMCLCL